ncbi:AAA family ATPase [Paenibacillus humicola]|uniref:AAA family ATPase n=1 Tax=Paenibacillus humicola TaxID=3110540 RepID=UPI00237BFD3B|nr:AAA family ATPase [Paenibacillus humicola]
MKPIVLRLSGLQSYREAQEVDFSRLCEAGVFGIFGSTGSGKSSILDAMTLALYGKVERAANGTQGIMNQAEKQLSVAFTFELAAPGERRLYRVERQFKRSGDVTVSNTLSRFIEVTEAGETVLADKLADVTRCVEERIGLNMQDFTRAVVLPQGKFAEFLSLTGKDRRQMLQRLFRLERFGDGLALKLNQRMKAAEAALNEAAAEQHGLGDASADAVDAASARHREAAAAAAAARAELAEAERLHAERLHVRERQEALRAKQALQAKLLEEAPKVTALERELQRLAAAERLLPALDAADAAEAALRAAASRREAAGRAHAARQQAAAEAAAARAAAESAAGEAEPRLALRLEQLAQAQRLEAEAAALAASAAEGERRRADAAGRQHGFGEQAAKAEDTLARAAQRQSELKAQLQQAELSAEERQLRTAAAQRLQHAEALRAQHAAAEREAEAAAGELERRRQALRAAEADSGAAFAALESAAFRLRSVRAETAALERTLRDAARELPARLERARSAERAAQLERLAAQLASSLADGEPCPVCGSLDHPIRLHAPDVNGSQPPETGAAEAWETVQQRTQELLLRTSGLHAKLGAAFERIEEALADGDAARRSASDGAVEDAFGARRAAAAEAAAAVDAEAASAADLLNGEARAPSVMGRGPLGEERSLQAAERFLQEAEHTYVQAAASFSAVEPELTSVRARRTEAQRRYAAAESASRAQEALAEAASRRCAGLTDELDRERREWMSRFGAELTMEQAQPLLDAFEQRETAALDLRSRLERSVTFIEETAAQLHRLRQSGQEAQLEAVELAARLSGLKEQLTEKERLLREWTVGRPAAELLREAERELRELRVRLHRLKEAQETAVDALQAASGERIAAEEAERAAAARKGEADAAMHSALQSSPFQSGDEAQSLRPLLPQQEAIAAQIAKYREAERQLAAQIELLRDQLGGRSVTDEEWERCVSRLQTARARGEELLQLAAKAERDAEELKARHERWTALEEKRLKMERLCERLKTLQTVFRGNAFVEYVAEEQLVQVCRSASERLGYLTKRRYALEVDSGGGFVIRDDAGGGIRRPVSTLSGGETFLASLALALALSGQIQLRGKYPLQFFFLDEGFGTLDPELLDTVITALEKLHHDKLAVGVISHVPELRARLPRRLIVTGAEPFGRGSTVALETM